MTFFPQKFLMIPRFTFAAKYLNYPRRYFKICVPNFLGDLVRFWKASFSSMGIERDKFRGAWLGIDWI